MKYKITEFLIILLIKMHFHGFINKFRLLNVK